MKFIFDNCILVYEVLCIKFVLPSCIFQRVLKLLRPAPDWGPHIYKFKKNYEVPKRRRSIKFVDYVRMNLIGSTLE